MNNALPVLMAFLLALPVFGDATVPELCDRLLPPGAADDTQARLGLHELVIRAARPGTESDRQQVVTALIAALAKAGDSEVKAFLISELQFAAKDEAVPALAGYLGDDRLSDPAARVLVTIGTRSAAEALRHSLGTGRLSVIQALGDLAYTPAAKEVRRYADAKDPVLRCAAWYALARMGDAPVVPVIQKYRTGDDRSVATVELLELARQLNRSKNSAAAAKICRAIITGPPVPLTAEPSEALVTLCVVTGEAALPEVRTAVRGAALPVRVTAVQLLGWMRSAEARSMLRATARTPDPVVRAAAIAELVRLQDAETQPVCVAALSASNQFVRIAAIRGLKGSPNVLLDYLPHAPKEELDELSRVLDSVPRAAVTGRWAKADTGLKVVLVEVMASWSGPEVEQALWRAVDDADEDVRLAALTVVSRRAMPADLPRWLDLVGHTRSDRETQKARQAVISLGRTMDHEFVEAAILTAMSQAQPAERPRWIPLLSEFGGLKAMAELGQEAQQADAGLQDAAVRALAAWRDSRAVPVLLELCRAGKTETHRVLAARGAMRLAEQSNAGAETWHRILDVAPREEEKQQVQAVLQRLEKK